MSIKFNSLSVISFCIGAFLFFLALYELPKNDAVNGRYINILMDSLPHKEDAKPEMKVLSPWLITEARIITSLYVVSSLMLLFSLLTGFLAHTRRERSIYYASTIALSGALLVLEFQYRWVITW